MTEEFAPGASCEDIVAYLRSLESRENVQGMARYCISSAGTLGIGMPVLHRLSKSLKGNHRLALELWDSGIHEARILAALIDDPSCVRPEQMDRWVAQIDSWDVCDQACSKLFDRTPFAWQKAEEWAVAEGEFVRRAGFVLVASLAVHDKKASDEQFNPFFPLATHAADDGRNYVKKAVSWCLRQMGKRNSRLHARAVQVAERLSNHPTPSGRWIARDVRRDLTRLSILERVAKVR